MAPGPDLTSEGRKVQWSAYTHEAVCFVYALFHPLTTQEMERKWQRSFDKKCQAGLGRVRSANKRNRFGEFGRGAVKGSGAWHHLLVAILTVLASCDLKRHSSPVFEGTGLGDATGHDANWTFRQTVDGPTPSSERVSIPYTSKYLIRRYLDPPNPPQTPSQKVLGCVGIDVLDTWFFRS